MAADAGRNFVLSYLLSLARLARNLVVDRAACVAGRRCESQSTVVVGLGLLPLKNFFENLQKGSNILRRQSRTGRILKWSWLVIKNRKKGQLVNRPLVDLAVAPDVDHSDQFVIAWVHLLHFTQAPNLRR